MDNRERILDWKPSYDERSRGFRAVAGIEDRELRSFTWTCNAWLDQGREGACVGFGWSHELCAKPKVHMVDNNFAFGLYNLAKTLDSEPGEAYSGTSVLAGAKAVSQTLNTKGLPLMEGYSWAFGAHDIVRAIAYKGPVVLGINWYENMYDPDEEGYIHVEGDLAGGHCILANAFRYRKLDASKPKTWDNIDLDNSRIRVHNSWGKDWGFDGEGFITIRDLSKLMDDDGGEACLPGVRRV